MTVENIQQEEGVECRPRNQCPARHGLPFCLNELGPVLEHKVPTRSILGALGSIVYVTEVLYVVFRYRAFSRLRFYGKFTLPQPCRNTPRVYPVYPRSALDSFAGSLCPVEVSHAMPPRRPRK